MTATELVEVLTRMRVRAGLTQQDVADEMGVTGAQVSQMENGKRTPRLDTLLRYAEAVGGELVAIRGDAVIVPTQRRRLRGISRRFHVRPRFRGVPA